MKKYFSLLIIFMLTVCNISVIARTELSDNCTSLSSWTVTTSGAGTVTEVENNGGIKLAIDAQSAKGSAEIEKAFSFDGNKLTVEVDFSVNIDAMDNSKNSMVATASDGTYESNMLYYKEGVLYAFTNNESYKIADSLATGTSYKIIFAVDKNNLDCAIWFKNGDGAITKVYNGKAPSDRWTIDDYTSFKLIFTNEITGRSNATSKSDFIIKNVIVNDAATTATFSPDTSGGILTPDSVDKISVDFGGKASPVMYNKSNYTLKKDGEITGFSFTDKLSGIEVVPVGGFEGGCVYTLSATQKKGIFEEDITVDEFSLTLVPAGYVVPVIEISASESEVYTGNTIDITSLVTSETAISKVVYTVDGETFEKTDASDNYKLSLQKEAGTYEVKAYAVDSLLGRSIEKSVTVVFKNNTAPTVSITNITDGAGIKANEFPEKIVVSASDAEALLKVEIYVDGILKETLTQAPFEYETSDISNGNHSFKAIAYDDGGLNAEDEVSFIILPGDKDPYVIYENDFGSYAGGVPSGKNFFWYDSDITTCTVDTSRLDTDGKAINIKGENNTEKTKQLFIRTDGTASALNKLRIEYDLKVKDLSEVTYMLKAGQTDNPHSQGNIIAEFNQTELVYYNNGSATNDKYVYPQNEWMKIFCEIDFISDTYTFKLSDKDGNLLSQATKNIPASWEWVKVCSYLNTASGKGFEVAFDNFKFSSIDSVPVITKIGQNGNENESVTPSAQNITVKLTAALKADSVTKDNISLFIGEEEILIKEVSYASMKITIVPDEQLRSQEEYTVLIKETTQMPTGEILGEEVKESFKTLAGELDLLTSSVVTSASGVKVTGEFVCTDSESKTIYIILSVWDGDKLKDTTVKEFNVSSSNKTFTTDSVAKSAGETMELYIWDSLVVPSSVATKIYRY